MFILVEYDSSWAYTQKSGFRYESLGQKSSNHSQVASYTVAHAVMTMIHMIEAFDVETSRSPIEK